MPILITVDCAGEVDAAELGQVIADAVTASGVPMVAEVGLQPEIPEDQQRAKAWARRTGQPEPGRIISYVVGVHLNPADVQGRAVEDLITLAYRAAAASADAAHPDSIRMSVLPLDGDRFERGRDSALDHFRTRPV